jgi:hypothetical protein
VTHWAMIRKLVHTAIQIILLSTLVSAQAPVPDVAQFGPQVGERVPRFSLTGQYGQRHNLESLMGPNGLWLYFSRSVDW